MDERRIKSIIALEMKAFVDASQDNYTSLEFGDHYRGWIRDREFGDTYNWGRMEQIAENMGYAPHD